MTDRDRQMIEYYIPHDPDPTLDFEEYYYLHNNRVIRVYALDIFPCKDGTEYGIYQKRGGRMCWIDSGWESPTRGVRMGDLYDNKEDCRDMTHGGCSWWKDLRNAQMKERMMTE